MTRDICPRYAPAQRFGLGQELRPATRGRLRITRRHNDKLFQALPHSRINGFIRLVHNDLSSLSNLTCLTLAAQL